jgi:transposase
LKVRPNKTDRNDAAGLAQIVRTGWFKQVSIKSRAGYERRSLLAAREALVRSRVKIENEIRGLLRTFGVLFGTAVGGFARRVDEIITEELEVSYLGLTPRRYESGEISRNGRMSKQGDKIARKHLYEAATSLLTRTAAFSTLKAWGLRLAKRSASRKPVWRSRASSPSSSTPCGKRTCRSVGA